MVMPNMYAILRHLPCITITTTTTTTTTTTPTRVPRDIYGDTFCFFHKELYRPT